MKKRKYTDDALIAAYSQEKGIHAIAAHLGISYSAARNGMVRLNLAPHGKGKAEEITRPASDKQKFYALCNIARAKALRRMME